MDQGLKNKKNVNLRNLNRIECIVTMACTGRCRHCSEGSHESFKDHLNGSAVENAIMQICKQYKIDSLMVFGGEPLLTMPGTMEPIPQPLLWVRASTE